MKKMMVMIIMMIMMAVFLKGEEFSIEENWSPKKKDKKLHLLVGSSLTAIADTVDAILPEGEDLSPEGKVSFVAVAAAGKEVGIDLLLKRGTPSIADFCYTMAPAVVNYIIEKYIFDDNVVVNISAENGGSVEIKYEIGSW